MPRFRSVAPPSGASIKVVPHIVTYLDESTTHYTVHDLDYGDDVRVPKNRAVPEPFPASAEQPLPGLTLIRWSGMALLLSVLGGIGGIIGGMTCIAAVFGMLRFGRRARRWRRDNASPALPALARSERDRLSAALIQSLMALMVSAGIVVLLIHHWR